MKLTPRQFLWLRVGAVAVLVVAALLIGRATGLADVLSRDELRARVATAGGWGVPLYVGAFALALLLHVPATGILFVAVAVGLYGRLTGSLLAYGSSMLGVLISFYIVRGVGGSPLAEVKNRLARRILSRLESHPILTVVALRILFFAGAPVNYGLALSSIRLRDYVVGSALGIIPPVVVLGTFFDLLIR